jgi:putative transposase
VELNTVYFYTVAILDWEHLLAPDKFKQIVLDSLVYLVDKNKIKVYGFVIMPNHIHIIWENIEMNGREMPYASFMKFTGHAFLKELEKTDGFSLERYKVDKNSREYQFWRRDSLPIVIHNRKMLEQN